MVDVNGNGRAGGHLWRIIQAHIDSSGPYKATPAAVAERMGLSRQTVGNWKSGKLPRPENLRAVAKVTGTPYLQVLRAALLDAGYLQESELPTSTPGHGAEPNLTQ